jgi:hypothetical protein
VSPYYMSLLRGLDAVRAFLSLTCGLMILISAREGKSGWAWFWAVVFVTASLSADLTYLRMC